MTAAAGRSVRCAIYTPGLNHPGLDQDFNSLDAQYDAAQAYIRSQAHAGWTLVRTRYDDGGFSGGSTDRPALQQLLADIRAHRVNVIVVYKVDRLTRSLADFAKLVELFDTSWGVLLWVTQQFNTTTSMGKLTLNVLLSLPSSSGRSPPSASATKSGRPNARASGSVGWPPWAIQAKDRTDHRRCGMKPKRVRHIFPPLPAPRQRLEPSSR